MICGYFTMQRIRIKHNEIRWVVGSLVVIVLFAAVVNVPYALTKMRSRTGARAGNSLMLADEEAAARGWAARRPHEFVWPDPDSWMRETKFGFTEYYIAGPRLREDGNRFSMEVQHLGWPLPVIEVKQMWWDWSDPRLEGPESDPAPGLLPLGLVMNPLIVGLPVWLLVGVLPVTAALGRRGLRARRGLCPWCGYAIEALSTCPECGSSSEGQTA